MYSITSPTIGEMVVADYRKAEVFRKFGIDYCCGGKKSLETVCRNKSIDPAAVQKELDQLDIFPLVDLSIVETLELDQLVDYIVQKHHAYVLNSLPILYELTTKVARVHGEQHPELLKIAALFNTLAEALQLHMHKEEKVLFPFIKQMALAARNNTQIPEPFFMTVNNPIRMMEAEHDSAGENMEAIRNLTANYTPPEEACTSYRVLFANLEAFESDLHRHVHLENNLLFPNAIQMEQTYR